MTKTAIFVEGHTELIFVREFLLKWFNYSNIAIECYTLFSDDARALRPAEYAFPNNEAAFYFQIVNAGGDKAVLSRMLNREQMLWNAGFSLIIGLRDMYSEDYRKLSQAKGIVSEINDRFIRAANDQISKRAQAPDKMRLQWAIMETEAWILGLYACFVRLNGRLTVEYITRSLSFDLSQVDPENSFFHPSNEVKQIYELAGLRYDKRQGDINSIMGHLQRSDFEYLLDFQKCQSFKLFVEAVET